jgi:hypothetical protein
MRRPSIAGTRVLASVVALTFGALVVPSAASAAPILLNFTATLTEPGSPDEEDSGLAVAAGAEITSDGSTNVGSLFFDDEYVDVSSDPTVTTIEYQIQGGADPHPDTNYSLTGWTSGTTLTFSNFVLSEPGTLVAVTVRLRDVIGEAGAALIFGTDYSFNGTSLAIFLAGLGILEQQDQLPLGLMTFDLTFRAHEQQDVPEPASLALFGAGLGLVMAARRRRQPRC